MILADKITALRKKAGWSQEELAEQPAPEGGVNHSAMQALLEEEDYTRENKAKSPVVGAVSGIYWLLVTAVYLFYTFGPMGNGQPKYSWFIWAVAGVLFGAVMLVVKLIARRK